jgi:hypothetical protein
MNYTRPQLAAEIEQIKKAFINAKNRGVRLRYLTETTSENISLCKQLKDINWMRSSSCSFNHKK